jgi:hypothetical protein
MKKKTKKNMEEFNAIDWQNMPNIISFDVFFIVVFSEVIQMTEIKFQNAHPIIMTVFF